MSVYHPPAVSTGDTCSGGCLTVTQLQYNYLRSYFTAHAFAVSSYRYEFITWFALIAIFAILAAFYHAGIADQTWIGAAWSRWAVRNRVVKTGRKSAAADRNQRFSTGNAKVDRTLEVVKMPSRKIYTFPSLGSILLLIALVLIPIALTLIGADYIRPGAGVFDMSESFPSNVPTNTPGLSRRGLEWGQGSYPSVSIYSPRLTLPYRTWWTAGSRLGAMTNALTPLIVITALKQIPFAVLSTRLAGGYAFDRLYFMHKWGGRIVWLFATSHIVLWSVQLTKEPIFYTSMWSIVFLWPKFRWGFVSYIFFTLLVALSIGPMRAKYYEIFYVCHVVCAIGFMLTAWLHHPPAGYWMYVTLLWWLSERIVRVLKVAWINGIGFTGRRPQVVIPGSEKRSLRNLSVSDTSSQTLQASYPPSQLKYSKDDFEADPYAAEGPRGQIDRRQGRKNRRYDPASDLINGYGDNQVVVPLQSMDHVSPERYQLTDGPVDPRLQKIDLESNSHSSHQSHDVSISTLHGSFALAKRPPRPAMAADVAAVIKPGYAYAQLLPGKTLRLTLRTPNPFSWQPGQYVNLCIPSVKFWQSHPFTVASAYNAGFPSSTAFQEDAIERGVVVKVKGEERTIVLLIRARRGFTHDLWDYVRRQREIQIRAIEEQTGQQYIRGEVAKTATGVHLRAIIDGPYGSIQRVRWRLHSTIVIIAGGSGITSAMSVLEYLCSVMAGNKQVKGFLVRRVRFVWMLREYAHLQWAASALRRCIEMVPPDVLQVDLFVTKTQRHQNIRSTTNASAGSSVTLNKLGENRPHSSLSHGMSTSDSSYNFTGFTEGTDQEDYEVNALDLTGYEGEENAPSAAEAKISERVAREGKLRRAKTRKASMRKTNGRALKAPQNTTLMHQTAVYENSRQNHPLHRMASTIPERDLGADGDTSREDPFVEPRPLQSADGFLQVHNNRPPMSHSLSAASMTHSASASGWHSPNGTDGALTPDYRNNSSYALHQGMETSSTTHLNKAMPMNYDGGAEMAPVVSQIDVPIDLDEEENADLQVLAELTRQGYPKLDTIIREEAQQSAGRVLVSACGPESLGRLIRSVASKQIDVNAVRKGHLNKHINIVSQSYD
jgi:hypothetical protein